jgi:hypothetical protein
MAGMKRDGFLPPRGNYRELKSFRKAEIVYDVTNRFCRRFLQRGDRTIDPFDMLRAGRWVRRYWERGVARSAEMVSALALARSGAEGG